MFYVPTSQLDSTRLPEVIEGLESQDVLLERQSEGNRISKIPLSKAEECDALSSGSSYFESQCENFNKAKDSFF